MIFTAGPARAQEPAVLTADAFPLGKGVVRLSFGFERSGKDDSHPAGELRSLTRILPASARFGLSDNVDVIAIWRGRLVAETGDGTGYEDWGDPSLFTKITLTDTGLPYAAGVLFGFKLPSSRFLPARLGSDAMDGYLLAAFTHRSGGFEARANAGLGVIGDPRNTGSQDDILTGSVLALWRPGGGVEIHAEAYGFTGPKEEDDKLQLRGGASVGLPFGTLTAYGFGRIAGSAYDFATAFTGSAAWGVGASLSHTFGW
jgi:hypothetical protein